MAKCAKFPSNRNIPLLINPVNVVLCLFPLLRISHTISSGFSPKTAGKLALGVKYVKTVRHGSMMSFYVIFSSTNSSLEQYVMNDRV